MPDAIAQYMTAQDTMSEQAKRTLTRLCDTLSGAPADTQRDALLDLLPGIADTYGDAMSEVAARWYEEYRAEQIGQDGYTALSLPSQTAEQCTYAVRQGAGALYGADGDIRILANSLNVVLDYVVREQARKTVLGNVNADPAHPGWARYAEGDACAWCVMVASQGGVYSSKQAAVSSKAGSRYHPGCRCVAVPCWGEPSRRLRDRLGECDSMYYKALEGLPVGGRGTSQVLAKLREMYGLK